MEKASHNACQKWWLGKHCNYQLLLSCGNVTTATLWFITGAFTSSNCINHSDVELGINWTSCPSRLFRVKHSEARHLWSWHSLRLVVAIIIHRSTSRAPNEYFYECIARKEKLRIVRREAHINKAYSAITFLETL
jgi:hypothetical protein